MVYTSPNGAVVLVAHPHAYTIHEGIYAMLVQHGYGVLAWDFRHMGRVVENFVRLDIMKL